MKAVADVRRGIVAAGARFHAELEDDRWRGPRRRELCIVRELFVDFIAGDNTYGESAASLDRYFLPFALAARIEVGRA